VHLELVRASVLLRVGAPAEGFQAVLSEGFVSCDGEAHNGTTTATSIITTTATTMTTAKVLKHNEHERRFHHLCAAPSGMHRMDIERLRQHSSCLFYGSDDTSIGAD
jgi:hypothetical protein